MERIGRVKDSVREVRSVAWARFRATFSTRWPSYLAVALVVGVLGGGAIASIAAARRTQSSFTALLASTNPSDLAVVTSVWNPSIDVNTGYDPAVIEAIRQLPGVEHVETYVGVQAFTTGADGLPVFAAQSTLGSVDGLLFDQDSVIITDGRMSDPAQTNEVVVSAEVATAMGIHVGDSFPVLFFTDAQSSNPADQVGPPFLRIDARLVGIGQLVDTVVRDDADLPETQMLFTPAITRTLADCCSYLSVSGLQLTNGSRDVAAVESEVAAILPPSVPRFFRVTSTSEAKAERAIQPESLALGVFGLIAFGAALLIACQVIGRVTRESGSDIDVLRALGAGLATRSADSLLGIGAAIIGGGLLAAAVAIGLSPLAPIGPVRHVRPHPSITIDWTMVGLGVGALILVLCTAAVILGVRQVTPPDTWRSRRRTSRAARAGVSAGLSVPAVVGIEFAFAPSASRSSVPVRSAVLGATLAMVLMTATLTFADSVDHLVSHPALYGWNWDLELFADSNEMPAQLAATQLNADGDIAAWTGYYFATLQIDGNNVPVLGTELHPTLAPALLSGHGLDAVDEIVLGATTLTELHKHVGDTVQVTTENATTRLRIVGTATMPTVGNSGGVHPTMGTGAVVDAALIPNSSKDPFGDPTAGPQAIFVKLKSGVDRDMAFNTLQEIASGLFPPDQIGAQALHVQRPAEIVNYRSMGATLRRLGTALSAGALIALGLTLIASVRRRRRDFALLKAIGFTNRQLAEVVSWHASIAAFCGIVTGVPLGIIGGRQLYLLFAHNIHAVAVPTVPILAVALTAVAGLLLANLVALLPSRLASQTNPASVLRSNA